MVVPSFNSPNFSFLAKHDVILVKHAALAERSVFAGANSALIKLRQFAELLAEHCAGYAAIPVVASFGGFYFNYRFTKTNG